MKCNNPDMAERVMLRLFLSAAEDLGANALECESKPKSPCECQYDRKNQMQYQ